MILDHGEAMKLWGYWCQHKVADEHGQKDGYGSCRAEKPDPLYWEHDPSKRRSWNSYVRGKP